MSPKADPAPEGDAAVVERRKKSKKPKYSRFTQQELPACKPLLTPTIVISTFSLIGILFIPIGLASLSASDIVVEIVYRYDTECIPQQSQNDKLAFIQSSETDKTCLTTLTVPKNMKAPVYIYYELDNFYQNHRRLMLLFVGIFCNIVLTNLCVF
ncbi:ALA-interacting subunit 3-like [Curcuma longa]|uniref:ALA-interacting subunit 3-like n=1 Tax=Curcuma longa TaxID=136217 RepID=UPI003D9F3875